jgi:hypothetical protein
MARAEQNRLGYLFRLRMTLNVKRSLQWAMQQSDWADAGQGWQGKATMLRLQGWSRHRRIILLRRKLARDVAMTIAPMLTNCCSASPRSDQTKSFGNTPHWSPRWTTRS